MKSCGICHSVPDLASCPPGSSVFRHLLFFMLWLNGLVEFSGVPSIPYKDCQTVLLLSDQLKLLDSVISGLFNSWEFSRFCNFLTVWHIISLLLIRYPIIDSSFISLWSMRPLLIYCFSVSRFCWYLSYAVIISLFCGFIVLNSFSFYFSGILEGNKEKTIILSPPSLPINLF